MTTYRIGLFIVPAGTVQQAFVSVSVETHLGQTGAIALAKTEAGLRWPGAVVVRASGCVAVADTARENSRARRRLFAAG